MKRNDLGDYDSCTREYPRRSTPCDCAANNKRVGVGSSTAKRRANLEDNDCNNENELGVVEGIDAPPQQLSGSAGD